MLTKVEDSDCPALRNAYVHHCGRADAKAKSPWLNHYIFMTSQPALHGGFFCSLCQGKSTSSAGRHICTVVTNTWICFSPHVDLHHQPLRAVIPTSETHKSWFKSIYYWKCITRLAIHLSHSLYWYTTLIALVFSPKGEAYWNQWETFYSLM